MSADSGLDDALLQPTTHLLPLCSSSWPGRATRLVPRGFATDTLLLLWLPPPRLAQFYLFLQLGNHAPLAHRRRRLVG
jgi:hypothetical protein